MAKILKTQSAAIKDARAILSALKKKGAVPKTLQFKGLNRLSKDTARSLARVRHYTRKFQGLILGNERLVPLPKDTTKKFKRTQASIRKQYQEAKARGDKQATSKYYSQLQTITKSNKVLLGSEYYVSKKGAVKQRGTTQRGIYTIILTGDFDVDAAAIQKVIDKRGPVVARTVDYRVFAHGVAFANGDLLLDWVENNQYQEGELDEIELLTPERYEQELHKRRPYRARGKQEKGTAKARKALQRRSTEARSKNNQSYYHTHKEEIKARAKQRYAENPEKQKKRVYEARKLKKKKRGRKPRR